MPIDAMGRRWVMVPVRDTPEMNEALLKWVERNYHSRDADEQSSVCWNVSAGRRVIYDAAPAYEPSPEDVKRVADELIDELTNRKGFRHIIDNLDDEVLNDVRECLGRAAILAFLAELTQGE